MYKNITLLFAFMAMLSCDNASPTSYSIENLQGDFNGDGYTDFASAHGQEVTMNLNDQSDGYSTYIWIVADNWGHPGWTVAGDFDGDGADDIASPHTDRLYLFHSHRNGFSSQAFLTRGPYSSSAGWTFACDYDGDGRDEIVSIERDRIYVIQPEINDSNEFGNFYSNTNFTTDQWSVTAEDTWIEDINGDNKDEILTKINDKIFIREWDGSNFVLREG